MFSRRRIPLLVAAACLLLASGAVAAEGDTFTANSTPSHVKPTASASYGISLTNEPTSPSRAQRATIAIPPGFSVDSGSIQATTQAVGGCDGTAWQLDGPVTSEINLRRPGNNDTGLCPGATLTVSFLATSATVEATYTWTSQLLVGDTEPFALNGSQPTVVVDGTAPETTIQSGPPGLTNSKSATFAFSANEPSSFQCQLDAGGVVPCSSPVSYQDLGDGTHTFVVRPTDAVGNLGAAASYSWTIDATAPETTLGSRPRARTTAVSAAFTFSATEAAAFQCRLDGAAVALCASPKRYTRLRRARHTFEVRAVDSAGNTDASPAVHRWSIAAAPRRTKAASALLAPRAGAQVTKPPLLRWRPVARAAYYNVQLYRGRVKVLSTWPTRPRLQLRARWTYLGRPRQLTVGTYRWYVWPGYGRASVRYGRLLGESTFTVKPASSRR